jgi:hypothetical protein
VEASRSNKQSLAAPHLLEHSRPSLLDPPEHSQGKTGVTIGDLDVILRRLVEQAIEAE